MVQRIVFLQSLLLGLLAGCAGPYSNALFAEDAEFLAALPAEDRNTVHFSPGSAGFEARDPIADRAPAPAPPGDGRPDLRDFTEQITTSVNGLVLDMLSMVDLVRSQAPTERADDIRTWGPWPIDTLGDRQLLVEIVRSGLVQYDWVFRLAMDASGPWTDIFAGTHFAGVSVVQGDGEFWWDLDALSEASGASTAGRMDVDYDNREGHTFWLDFHGVEFEATKTPWTATYWYSETPASIDDANTAAGEPVAYDGDFEYLTTADVGSGPLLETILARTRWTADGAGRSDATVSGGDLSEALTITQCWDSAGAVVYWVDSYGMFEVIGSVGACAYPDALYPEHLDRKE
jgi:hypothetical protein